MKIKVSITLTKSIKIYSFVITFWCNVPWSYKNLPLRGYVFLNVKDIKLIWRWVIKKYNAHILLFRSSRPEAFLGWGVLKNMQQIYRRTPMPKCDFNKVTLQLYWNRTLAWVFSCKYAAYFQNTFSLNTSGRLLLSLYNFACKSTANNHWAERLSQFS